MKTPFGVRRLDAAFPTAGGDESGVKPPHSRVCFLPAACCLLPIFACLLLAAGCTGGGKPNLVAGEQIWTTCTVCHSTREMQRGPLLEGRESWYVETQLRKYRRGWRGTNTANRSEFLMASALDKLPNDEAIRDVAAWIESLPPVVHRDTVRGDPERGRELFVTCAACHGADGGGKRILGAPSLAGLEDWYVLDQLRKYRNGQRGYHRKDTRGKQMQTAVGHLEPEDLKDLTVYIRGL